ncbi:MAG: tetratricopeptide repeat protein [Planctomycetota bacterium]
MSNRFSLCLGDRHCRMLFVSLLVTATVGCGPDAEKSTPSERIEKPVIDSDDSPTQTAESQDAVESTNVDVEPAEEPLSTTRVESSETRSTPTDPVTIRDTAIESLESGKLDRAFELARKAKRLDPENPETIFLNARVLAARHRFAEAVQILDDLALSVPDARLPVLGQTAEWMVTEGRFEEAEARFKKLSDLVGEGGLVSRRLAQLFLRQGRCVEAAAHLRLLCNEGNVEEGELRTLLTVSNPIAFDDSDDTLEPIGVLGRVRSLISANDWAAARAEIESVDSPSSDESAIRARIYATTQDFDSLRAWLEGDGKQTGNTNADGWFAVACLSVHDGEHAQAVDAFCNVVLRDPTDAEAYAMMSDSLSKLGIEDKAKLASTRSELLLQTQKIGKRMSKSESPDTKDLSTLTELLGKLRRPSEALAWRAVETIYAQSRSEITREEAIKRLEQINRNRLELPSDARGLMEFVLCGIDPQALLDEQAK